MDQISILPPFFILQAESREEKGQESGRDGCGVSGGPKRWMGGRVVLTAESWLFPTHMHRLKSDIYILHPELSVSSLCKAQVLQRHETLALSAPDLT